MNNGQPRITVRERFFGGLAALTIRHKVLLFSIVGVLTIASLISLFFLEIRTTRQGMTQKNLPEQIRFNRYMDNFGTTTQLVVLLEGQPDQVKAAADDAAAALSRDKQWVRNVFYRVDISTFEKSGLYYLKTEDLEKACAFLQDHRAWLSGLLSSRSLAVALDRMSTFPGAATSPSGVPGGVFPFLDALLGQWADFLEKPDQKKFELIPKDLAGKLAAEAGGQMTDGGYILGRDGKSALLFVQQSKNIDETSFTLPFMAYCRMAIADALKRHPGVTAGFTGWPVAIEEEMKFLKRDLGIVTIGSTVGILLLLLVSFRSIRKTLFVFVPHTFGVIWNLGATYLVVGHLSYFSSVFFGLLFSLGTEYGIVFIRRFSEERTRGCEPEEAITRTFQTVGPGLVTSSLATVTSFIAISIAGVPGLSEMGTVAATGMFCLIAATLIILPLILLVFGMPCSEATEAKVVGSRTINWIWDRLGKFPALVLGLGVAVTIIAVALVPMLTFDYNIDNLLPAQSETLAVSRKLEKLTGYKSQYLVVTADNLDQARKIHHLLLRKPTVGNVESLSPVIPADQEAKQKVLASLSGVFTSLPHLHSRGDSDPAAIRAKLVSFIADLEKKQEDAFSAGLTRIVGQLDHLIGRLQNIVRLLDSPDATTREAAFESAVAQSFTEGRERLNPMLAACPVTIDSIPKDLKERFVGKDGNLVIMVFPKEQIWDMNFLERFVTEVRDAATQVLGEQESVERTTGFGAVYLVTSKMATSGFRKAMLMTFCMVAVLLLIDFKRFRDAVMASLPFMIGIAWTLAAFVIVGRGLNMASQIALPVLIGIGVDFGIHTVHRWREPDGADLTMLVSTTGGSLWLAAATNLIGFGLLLLAKYRGLISFGLVLSVGIFICFIGAMFGLPSMIKALHLDRGRMGQNRNQR